MIILIDGPEKAGKSTLVQALVESIGATSRHWGPVEPDDRAYTELLKHDCMSQSWYIWDRAWPSEHVYGLLLERDRRLTTDPFLGEWLHGRAVQTRGLRIMLMPNNIKNLRSRRDSTDLNVDPMEECTLYGTYASNFGYDVLKNDYTADRLSLNVEIILKKLETLDPVNPIEPPLYAGPLDAKVVVVGEARSPNTRTNIPGSWLPFTSRLTTQLGRRLHLKAFKFGWTNVGDVPLEFLEDKYVLACGEQAGEWLYGSGITRVVIPHPAWLYRYNTPLTQMKSEMVDKVLKFLGELA